MKVKTHLKLGTLPRNALHVKVPLIPVNGSYFASFGNSKSFVRRPKKDFVSPSGLEVHRCSKIVQEDLEDLHCKERSTSAAGIAVIFKFTRVLGGIVTATA